MSNAFLPDSYDVPSSSDGYMKLTKGENRFRILSSPILGWEYWTSTEDGGRKPIRTPYDKPFSTDQVDDPSQIKHFWAMVVWNYQTEKIQILEITQKGIQRTLRALAKDADWGSPVQTYDIVVSREGDGLETSYEVRPKPAKPIDPAIVQVYKDMQIDLTALYKGDDPFAASQDVNPDDIPDDLGK